MIARPLVIAWKELLQLRRDRLTLAMMVMLPLLQLLLFGYAIDTDVRHIPTVVYDQDASSSSRDLARSLEASGFYDLVGAVRSFDEVDAALRSGRARVALVVGAGFGAALAGGGTAEAALVLDGSDPQVVASASQTAASLVAGRNTALLLRRLARTGHPAAEAIHLEADTRFNPELRTAVYVVPGLVGVILTMTMVMLTAMGIAREAERGTLEQLIVSPIRSHELILGKIAPYVLIGYVQMSLILLAGKLIFDVPFRGSLPLLFALAFLFIAANLALGLFFSTLARTQQQAMQMSFFFILPNILLSGFMFPFEAMPRPAQFLAQGLPLTHFLRIVRGIALKGASFADVGHELGWLGGIFLALVLVASLRFRKKLG